MSRSMRSRSFSRCNREISAAWSADGSVACVVGRRAAAVGSRPAPRNSTQRRKTSLASVAEGIDESVAGRALAERHRTWADRLPNDAAELWTVIASMTVDDVLALLAHCASLALNAVQRPGAAADAGAHADVLARAMPFEMSRYWQPTVANYLGRVSKECILAAVTECAGEGAARQMASLKKQAMAAKAEELLAGKNWLPPLLRPAA